MEKHDKNTIKRALSDAQSSFDNAMDTTKSSEERQKWLKNYKQHMDVLEQEIKAQDEAYRKKRALHMQKIREIMNNIFPDDTP